MTSIDQESVAIELLCPARNKECAFAAIDHGADAVYIGASRFGARAAAGNTVEDIAEICTYAHKYKVRIYVTVNTILYDEELKDTELLIWELYKVGVDALIIQDLAILKMNLPPIPLHASTQMDNRTPEQVAWLRSLGFAQVVLARELSIEQIRAIHQEVPDVPLEAFVHGALCVSYSGQCYASQYCFRRSANRGECAQFCRLPFTLEDANGNTIAEERHFLSLRDMNRTDHLEEMMDAGVRSFKIEGRLKDVSYVKNVTAWYRRHIDAILRRRPDFHRSSLGHETYSFTPDPARSFSRGFTNYFLKGRTSDIASMETPKSIGQPVGVVKDIRNGCIIVAGTTSFSNGDGLCYLDENAKLMGFRVNRVEGNHLYPERMPNIHLHTKLFRNFDQEMERLLSRSSAKRCVYAYWLMEETPDGFRLSFFREDGASATKEFSYPHELARSNQNDSIREVLSRMGDTIYEITDVEISFSQNWFIPRSQLAEWRRVVVQEELHVPESKTTVQDIVRKSYHGEKLSYLSNVSNHLSKEFYLEHGVKEIEPAFEQRLSRQSDSLLMTCKYCIRYQMGYCPKHQNPKVKFSEPWFLVSRDGLRFRLKFDCPHCQMLVFST